MLKQYNAPNSNGISNPDSEMKRSNASHKTDARSAILANNLALLMQQYDLTEAALAKATNVPQPTLHKILKGSTTNPRIATLSAIAHHFGTSSEALYAAQTTVSSSANRSPFQSIPIISWQDCLEHHTLCPTLTPTNWENWLVVEYGNPEQFALVSKPSMVPRFPNGTLLIIDPTLPTRDGDFVVAHYLDTHEATLKILSLDGPLQRLVPLNPSDSVTPLTPDIKMLGTLIQSRFQHY
ncbi:MAG: helix-turn-helix domain-containing protein [Gammaproteobacteria bacterium]|nr:helix-turn-helix domain-containing protein [Gammaproteobacteria bacterium]